jgi:hypothetical protein
MPVAAVEVWAAAAAECQAEQFVLGCFGHREAAVLAADMSQVGLVGDKSNYRLLIVVADKGDTRCWPAEEGTQRGRPPTERAEAFLRKVVDCSLGLDTWLVAMGTGCSLHSGFVADLGWDTQTAAESMTSLGLLITLAYNNKVQKL